LKEKEMAPRRNKYHVCGFCKDVNPSHGDDANCPEAPAAAAATTPPPPPVRAAFPPCEHCGRNGHQRSRCFKLICERCGNYGHDEPDCRVQRHDFFCTFCRNYRKHSLRECRIAENQPVQGEETE
jgi:hypothetical protein